MKDPLIEAIESGAIGGDSISFDLLRRSFGRGIAWDTLGRGKAILQTVEQLDGYLHAYGPMTRRQWKVLLDSIEEPTGPLRIVDYGCGQGLACALLFDHFGWNLVTRVQRVVLIEPSSVALRRAAAIVSCYCRDAAEVVCIQSELDVISTEQLQIGSGGTTVHLFSNVLDLQSVDIDRLMEKVLVAPGVHRILAVSPGQLDDGPWSRIERLSRIVEDPRNWDGDVAVESSCGKVLLEYGKQALLWEATAHILS